MFTYLEPTFTDTRNRYVEHVFADRTIPFPLDTFPNIRELSEAALRGLSARNLRAASRVGPGVFVRPIEANYQNDFYRSLHAILGYSMDVSSEWSPDGDDHGRIDFRLHAVKWGFELLRDGNRLREHCERSTDGGRYSDWVDDGLLEDWLIIDCRFDSMPHTYSKFLSWDMPDKLESLTQV